MPADVVGGSAGVVPRGKTPCALSSSRASDASPTQVPVHSGEAPLVRWVVKRDSRARLSLVIQPKCKLPFMIRELAKVVSELRTPTGYIGDC